MKNINIAANLTKKWSKTKWYDETNWDTCHSHINCKQLLACHTSERSRVFPAEAHWSSLYLQRKLQLWRVACKIFVNCTHNVGARQICSCASSRPGVNWRVCSECYSPIMFASSVSAQLYCSEWFSPIILLCVFQPNYFAPSVWAQLCLIQVFQPNFILSVSAQLFCSECFSPVMFAMSISAQLQLLWMFQPNNVFPTYDYY
jgi:hypothetical protein